MEVGRRGGSRSSLSQINVTPLVDVMLVLLTIFMITAPMLDQGIKVNLPEVSHAPTLAQSHEPLVVSVTRKGTIAVGHSRVNTPEKLVPVLKQILKGTPGREVFLEADRDVPYGHVVQVMAAMRRAGVQKLGMVSQEPKP
ncbi:MAG TPA: protein TolR [Desulfuromonadales bacterium]|nr:protein TolR [Desulfuromonadales bacterium]